MAAANVKISGLDALDFGARRSKVMDRVEEAVETSLEKGEAVMKEAVATRGTGNTWSRPWGPNGRTGSFPGRIDSGDMQKGVRGEITESTAHRVTGSLGWDPDSPEYIAFQDQGFRHVLTGEYVEGMMALRDGAEVTKRSLLAELDNIAKEF